ncbi:MAG: hypothetical protein M1830_005644, partial [Pleopsidium flavum]
MKTSNMVAPAGSSGSTNRRQPIRQTRTNPSRTSVTASGALGNRVSLQSGLENGPAANSAPGFFPAITHFTDSISALPKEIIRHFTLLKEVDAKVFGPEETLSQLVDAAANAPAPLPTPAILPSGPPDRPITNNATAVSASTSAPRTPAPVAPGQRDSGSRTQAQAVTDDSDIARRSLFYNLRVVVSEMLMTLDEKNHVLSTATEALNKQLARVDSSFPYIEGEISEEARYGSLTHWAYADKSTGRANDTTAGERSRRDVVAANNLAAAAAAVHEGEAAVSRSESRREAMLARKQRNLQVESDFDDGRQSHPVTTSGALKRAQGSTKVRKAVDGATTTNGGSLSLGIMNGTTSVAHSVPSKRRRIEKPATMTGNGGPAMERSMSTVMQNNGGVVRGRAASPREIPATDGSKKRARGGAAPSGVTRKRNNTNASVAGSPSLISSPIAGTSTVLKDSRRSSPAPGTTQRPPSSRARQNSTQSVLPDSRQRAQSSALNRQTNGNGIPPGIPDMNKIANSTGRTIPDIKDATKESIDSKGERLVDEKAAGDARGGPNAGSKPTERPLKREETENGNPPKALERTTSITTTTTRKASKTSTPVTTTFPESHRSRPSRTTEPSAKRSHKKGAGAAAQQLIAAAAADDEGSSMQGDDDEDDEDEAEP